MSNDVRELSKKAAFEIKAIAFKFNKVFFETFKDYLYRAMIYSLPEEPEWVRIVCLVSDEDGSWRKYIYAYNVTGGEFYFGNDSSKHAFINAKARNVAIKAFEKFLVDIVDTGYDISCIFVDLGDMIYNSSDYYSVSVGKSQIENSFLNMYIRAHSSQFKDINSFVTASRLVGNELANF